MWLPVLSAVLGITAFLPFNFYPVAFIFLVPLFLFFIREEKFWRLVAGALFFRSIFAIGTAYYTLEPISWSLSLLIFLGLPISIWLIKKLSGHFHWSLVIGHWSFFFLPFLWTLFDLLQAQYSLMPTYIISAGNALGSSPFLGLAHFGGFVGLTFFAAVVNALVAALFLTWKSDFQVARWFAVAAAFMLLFGWQLSQYELRKNADAYASLPNSITIATVSTNSAFTPDDFSELTQELSQQKTDLTVLPENMLKPHEGFTKPFTFNFNTNLLATRDTIQDSKKYISAVLSDAEGNVAGTHDKNRLTFAGEYWPFGSWHLSFYDWLKARDSRISTYAIFDQKNAKSVGERNLLSLNVGGNSVQFAVPICLEMHYPADLAKYQEQGARFIVNPSSNRWIGIGLNHFLYLTNNLKKIESVFLQLPIISSGVNDFAGIILPSGESGQSRALDKNYVIYTSIIRY